MDKGAWWASVHKVIFLHWTANVLVSPHPNKANVDFSKVRKCLEIISSRTCMQLQLEFISLMGSLWDPAEKAQH